MERIQSTVYVGNLSEKVTEDVLYELFLQAGPVVNVSIPSDRGRPKPFGFVQFKHPCSVLYAIKLFDGINMFGKTLRLNLPKGAMPPGLPPPMGLPVLRSHGPQPEPIIHPLSLQGRLGPPKYFGRTVEVSDRVDFKDRNRPRRRDDMMPSDRSKKNRNDTRNAPEFDMDAIPDLLDPLSAFGPPVPSRVSKSFHDPSNQGRRRDHPYENKGSGPHHDTRRERHSHYSSNHRRHF